jgi:hypothetical protein
MSYHIYVDNKKNVKFSDILDNRCMLRDVKISFGKAKNDLVENYSKLYLPLKSSRGVAITKNDEEYDIELNTGSSKEDYYLSTRIALALAELNDSLITPEFDDTLSSEEFEKKYDMNWAKDNQVLGINSLTYLIKKDLSTAKLNGCVRPYYFGQKVNDKLSKDNPSEQEFANRVISGIRDLQFIEQNDINLNVPTLMEADFPEGTKTFISVHPEFKLLLIKADYIILRDEKNINRVLFDDFLNRLHSLNMLKQVDEEQYIIEPLNKAEYLNLMTDFEEPKKNLKTKKSKKKWKFW